MERRKPQQARAEKRRVSLLDAAAALVEREGHAAVTTGAIAQEAGASVGTVYEHFPNKEAVLTALLARYRTRLTASLKSALADETSTLEALIAQGVAAYARFHEAEPGYAALWLGGPYLAPLADDIFARQQDFAWQQDFASPLADGLHRRFGVPKRHAQRMALTLIQTVSAQIGLATRRSGRERAQLLEGAEWLARPLRTCPAPSAGGEGGGRATTFATTRLSAWRTRTSASRCPSSTRSWAPS